MTEKNITLHGKQYPVIFDLQTIMNFEEITGHSIFGDNLSTMKSRIAIIMSAVLSADEKTDITIEAIVGDKDWQTAKDIIAAYVTIDALATEFFKIPDIEKQADEAEQPETTDEEKEDGAKN